MQQPVGEDVAALGVAAELDFVDRQEIDIDIARHRLDGADPVARPLRLDLLFAGDERDLVGADAGRDLVVDLAREQTQRQTDHAALVAEHALDREMRLAGIGRPEHRGDIADAGFEITRHIVHGLRIALALALQSEACKIKDLIPPLRPVSGRCGGRSRWSLRQAQSASCWPP